MPATCPVCGTRSSGTRAPSASTAPICMSGPGRTGVRPLRRSGRDGHRGRRLGRPRSLLDAGSSGRRGDFFRLTVEQLESLDQFARKSTKNLYAARSSARVVGRWPGPTGLGDPAGRRADGDRPDPLARRRIRRPTTTSRWAASRRLVRARSPELRADRDGNARGFDEVRASGRRLARHRSVLRRPGDPGVLAELVDAGVEPERPPTPRQAPATPRGRWRVGRRRDRDPRGVQPSGSRGGDPRGRRQGRRFRLEEDRLPRGQRECRLEAREAQELGVPVLDEDASVDCSPATLQEPDSEDRLVRSCGE